MHLLPLLWVFLNKIIFLAKLAFDTSENAILLKIMEKIFSNFEGKIAFIWIFRILFGAFAITFNILMIKFYIQSMTQNGATKATIFNFAFNFLLTVFCYFVYIK